MQYVGTVIENNVIICNYLFRHYISVQWGSISFLLAGIFIHKDVLKIETILQDFIYIYIYCLVVNGKE